ncbi:MAG: DUF3306 domain-containing protein [Ruegeria sp.]
MNETRDFWSRRKAAVQAEADAEVTAVEVEAVAARQAELEEKTDAEILAELGLPNPEELQAGDDVSGFMAKAVPDRLRRRALRRFWRLNPVLANVDGLVDYGEDYTDASCVIENIQTAYQVGKGMLAHIEALSRSEEELEDDVGEFEEEETDTLSETIEETAEVMVEVGEASETDDDQPLPSPRRMKFEFEA